jgi:hypothetical protein
MEERRKEICIYLCNNFSIVSHLHIGERLRAWLRPHTLLSGIYLCFPGSGKYGRSGMIKQGPDQCCGSGCGSQDHIFRELSDNFLGKKFYNSLKIGPHFFSSALQTKIIFNFCEICGYIKRYDNLFFFQPSLLLLFLDPGFGIRDGLKSGSGIKDKHPGSATLVRNRFFKNSGCDFNKARPNKNSHDGSCRKTLQIVYRYSTINSHFKLKNPSKKK